MLLWTSVALGASIAIADLDNHTGNDRLDAAGPGTASILVTRLASVPDLTVVERTKLQAVLNEIELSKGGAVDDASRVEAGRIIGADFIVLGTLVSLDPGKLTVAVRVVDTETAEVVRAEEVLGEIQPDGSGLLPLVDKLASTVIESLPGDLEEASATEVSSVRIRELEALLKYGEIGSENRPAATTMALWRDRSRDMLSDGQRWRFTVFTEGGAHVPNAREFAKLVGDDARLARFDNIGTSKDDKRDRKEGRRHIGLVYTPEEADTWIARYNDALTRESTTP